MRNDIETAFPVVYLCTTNMLTFPIRRASVVDAIVNKKQTAGDRFMMW